jgi:protein-disulfide isomerase
VGCVNSTTPFSRFHTRLNEDQSMNLNAPFFTTWPALHTTGGTVLHTKLTWAPFIFIVLFFASVASAQDSARLLKDLGGFDFSRLSTPAKNELASVLTDEFDACGRPLTLMGSLKKGDACKHTKRMVAFAATLAESGSSAQEIIVALSKYGQSYMKPRAKFQPDARQCVGPTDAKVTLVEFSDFECPYCAQARPLLEEFAKRKTSVRFCMMPYPLPMHSNAVLASQAVFFARESGKFWAMHDALFENQLSISPEYIKGLVVKLGLDGKAFEKAVTDSKFLKEIEASKEAGKTAQIDSTPTIFFNGRKLNLPLTEESLLFALEDELEFMGNNQKWTATP